MDRLVEFFLQIAAHSLTRKVGHSTLQNPPPSIFFLADGKPVPVEPVPITGRDNVQTAPSEFDELCLEFGLQSICECGTWKGEILGLEVMRVTDG